MNELDIYEPGDDVDPFELTAKDVTTRSSRRISATVTAQLTIEVVEPPTVFEAELKGHIRAAVMRTLSNIGIGVPTDISVEVTTGRNAR